jgi:hypothetical protein
MLEAKGMIFDNEGALISKTRLTKPTLTFSMWGANEDFWIGGNWARGRAVQTNVMLHRPLHNFCAIPSGARGFAGGKEDAMQEVAVQLYNLYPCCPGTRMPIADLRYEDLHAAISRLLSSTRCGKPSTTASLLRWDSTKAYLKTMPNLVRKCLATSAFGAMNFSKNTTSTSSLTSVHRT